MRNDFFNLTDIPKIENITEEIAKDTLVDIKENYKKLTPLVNECKAKGSDLSDLYEFHLFLK